MTEKMQVDRMWSAEAAITIKQNKQKTERGTSIQWMGDRGGSVSKMVYPIIIINHHFPSTIIIHQPSLYINYHYPSTIYNIDSIFIIHQPSLSVNHHYLSIVIHQLSLSINHHYSSTIIIQQPSISINHPYPSNIMI